MKHIPHIYMITIYTILCMIYILMYAYSHMYVLCVYTRHIYECLQVLYLLASAYQGGSSCNMLTAI